MAGGFSNRPRILKGAFVEFGVSVPPLFVVFQFNPEELTRSRSMSFAPPNEAGAANRREYYLSEPDLFEIQAHQQVTLEEESIDFEIRLDATDRLEEGEFITRQFGIAPQLAALEMMVHPREESILGAALDSLLGTRKGFSFSKRKNPPMILFTWGRKRVLPVNIASLNVTETEFSTELNPLRATVSVSLTVIEGPNPLYQYSKTMKEAMSVLNLAKIADIADIAIPM